MQIKKIHITGQEYGVRFSILGSFGGNPNTSRTLTYRFSRFDDSKVVGEVDLSMTNTTIGKASQWNLLTYTNTKTDPFFSTGTKLEIINNSGQTLTITGIEITFFGR